MSKESYNYLLFLIYVAPENEVDGKGNPVEFKGRTLELPDEKEFNKVKEQMNLGKRWIVFNYGSQKLPITVNLGHPNLCWAKLSIEKEKEGSTILLPNGRLPSEIIQ